MTADEIRELTLGGSPVFGPSERLIAAMQFEIMREIAAQLAELNNKFSEIVEYGFSVKNYRNEHGIVPIHVYKP